MASVIPEGLTCQGKCVLLNMRGCGFQASSRKGRLSRTPALHLFPTQSLSSSSSSSSSTSSTSQDLPRAPAHNAQPLEKEKEVENLTPRRPLKLAPLKLPLEVREAQRQKIRSAHEAWKPAAISPRCPRKAKVCWMETPGKAPDRVILSTIAEHHKPLQLANQVKKEGQVEGSQPIQSAPASKNICQSGALVEQQDAVRRRMRLRRTQRLEEDQSKSGSSAGGMSGEECTPPSTEPGMSQAAAQNAPCDVNHVLMKKPQEPVVCKKGAMGQIERVMAGNDVREAIL